MIKEEELYLETENREAILNAYRAKAECLIMLRDTSARTYMLQWFEFKDSVLQAEKSANVAKYEVLYETEKKEQENKLLQQENELNRLILLIIGVVVLLLIVLGLWLFNRNNLKKKQHELLMLQKLQNDKERIARDLHDNVGGQLSFIIHSLDGINDEEKEKRIDLTESINQSVRSVINSLRETIWAISDANINVQDFSDKLKLFARTLFKHSNTEIYINESIWKRDKYSGMFKPAVKVGVKVNKKDILGTITGPFGKFNHFVKANNTGYIINVNESPIVYQGDALFHISTKLKR